MRYETKACPRCGAVLYADMNVCYGCLYDFSRDKTRHARLLPEPPSAGEVEQATAVLGATTPPGTDEVGVQLRTSLLDVWVSVPPEGLSFGRSPANDVVLHSPAVSRRHLRLTPTPDGMEVVDLDATNPALYCGRDVRGRVIAPYGDSIDLCGCLLTMTGPS